MRADARAAGKSPRMLEVEDLEVRYGASVAVKGIHFEISEGEAIALIGPNGAGKTTTLKAICGTVKAATGQVRYRGEQILGETPEAIVRKGVVMVPEGRRIFGTLTVADNLRLGAATREPGSDLDGDIETELERFPVLKRYYHSNAGRLSGGEQQMLAIARALVARPDLLLLDEPSLGLAPILVDQVFETLIALRDEDMTILLVEQNATAAVDFADKTYVLRTGRIAAAGSASELGDPARLANLYLGES